MTAERGNKRDYWNETAGTLKNMIAGGVAGAVSRTAVSPLERMKILFQVQGTGVAGGNYSGVISTLARMRREEGWRGYFKGNLTNIVRIVPYSAVQFSTYELAKQVSSSSFMFSYSKDLVAES